MTGGADHPTCGTRPEGRSPWGGCPLGWATDGRDLMGSDQRRVVVDGVAAAAIYYAEMGYPEDVARSWLLARLQQVGATDAEVVRDAAESVARQPQPLEESAEETERARPIREMLGVTSAEDQLSAALTAREWLERLAADLSRE